MLNKNFFTKTRWLVTIILLLFLVVTKAWGATCTLSNANIVAGSGSTSYGAASATDGCSKTWNAYAIKNHHSNATSSYKYWQIKKYASSTAYYVQVPTMAGKINSITITVSSTSQPMTGGGNSATLFFSSSNSTSATGTGVASGTGASSVTIDCSALDLTGGYITAGGAVRIWDVEVTYCVAPTSLTNGTITSSTAHLSWSDASSTGSYEVYRSTSNTAPAYDATPTTTVTTKYVDLESLTSGTTYYWWVRSKCSNTNKSAWVAGTSFDTPSAGCSNYSFLFLSIPF